MSQDLAPMDLDSLGPAMLALPNDRMRRFVAHLVEFGCTQAEAAIAAGYGGENATRGSLAVTAHRLYHDERVQAAILEESRKILRRDAPAALKTVREIMLNVTSADRDRLAAAKMILERSGLGATSEMNINVNSKTTVEIDRELAQLLAKAGLDDAAKQKLLGGPVIDVPSEEVVEEPAASKEPPAPKYRRGSPEHSQYMKDLRAGEEARLRIAEIDPGLAEIL